ncbi:MAG TPA: heme ABC exporter ATP-binding protein CcmA [Methanosarcinales archaeon]|nr:heme ABC exporter ATP-binding protein CcmA [Methanosarcinales archaeon]
MIRVHNLVKNFGRRTVFAGIDFVVKKGDFLTIIGPNGAGKTTLLKIMATLLKATDGSVEIGGFDVKNSPERVREIIGVISHNTYLYNELTAQENLKFFGKMYKIQKINTRIDEVLEQTGLSYEKHNHVGTFSRGMKQRLSIARAILHRPSVLLLDEPYTGLDQHASAGLEDVLSSLTGSGITTVMVSHDLGRGLLLCDHLLIMAAGGVAYHAPTSEIADADELQAVYCRCIDTNKIDND